MATSIRHRIEQAEALVAEKQAAYDREKASMDKEISSTERLLKTAKRGGKPVDYKGKTEFLRIKGAAANKAGDEVIAAQNTLLALYDEDLRNYYQKMRGLLSYGIATGQTNPDCRLLYDSLGDYLEAKSESDRGSAQKAVNLCLQHGNFDSTEGESVADDEVLRRFEAISDPEDRSRFYSKQQKEILAAFEARKNNNLLPFLTTHL